jgi:hypothetical protein
MACEDRYGRPLSVNQYIGYRGRVHVVAKVHPAYIIVFEWPGRTDQPLFTLTPTETREVEVLNERQKRWFYAAVDKKSH